MLLITEADQYMGYAIASHLGRYPALRSKIRLLCKNKTICLNFEHKGMDVHCVDYNHPHHLSLALRGVDHIILAVGHDDTRVSMAKHLIQTAVQSGIKSILLVSHVGAASHTHETLQQYADIERLVIDTDCQWTILRPDWLNQNFHLWAPYIEKHRHLPLPIPDDTEMCPIDMKDICKVIEQLILDKSNKNWKSELDDLHNGQVYTLTGSQVVNPKELVQMLSQATGYTKMEYKPTRPMDLAYYFNELKRDIWFDARIKHEKAQIYRDDLLAYDYCSKAFGAPSAIHIQTMLEYFDWIQKTASSICVPHAPMITSLPCRSLRKFFSENANTFKPRV
ncbi:uncharacterized protein BX664DRAFT_383583 [Halteromyces radiatus]|uniref:uncharacterized protein n=1 Tax=Halteromyces radiatus TaxID=101107 RepID=UPI0022207D13|nr:uncharacterized protein BX664DRAFT_383583 [Halteromyces radiatus]KAI8097279.1 hypothetical protein BX664DRAFT_383583 [Halteromyces radiatus]